MAAWSQDDAALKIVSEGANILQIYHNRLKILTTLLQILCEVFANKIGHQLYKNLHSFKIHNKIQWYAENRAKFLEFS